MSAKCSSQTDSPNRVSIIPEGDFTPTNKQHACRYSLNITSGPILHRRWLPKDNLNPGRSKFCPFLTKLANRISNEKLAVLISSKQSQIGRRCQAKLAYIDITSPMAQLYSDIPALPGGPTRRLRKAKWVLFSMRNPSSLSTRCRMQLTRADYLHLLASKPSQRVVYRIFRSATGLHSTGVRPLLYILLPRYAEE